MDTIRLYHTGFGIIERPDIGVGRKNADFGQGFYLSDDEAFSRRWAREHRDRTTYLNTYELDPGGLNIRRFARNPEWFDYIYSNRSGLPDSMAGFDAITGPIANDTIYDTWGISTSGLLRKDQAIKLLMIGPQYEQTVLKTEKAVAALRFIGARAMDSGEIAAYRDTVRREEERFQEQFLTLLGEITGIRE